MTPDSKPPRDSIALSRELKSIAEAGLRYRSDVYDRNRYRRIHEISSEILAGAVPDFAWPVEFGYATPKADVRAAVPKEAGGFLLVREVFEESGIVAELVKLIACWNKERQGQPRQPEHSYKLVFLCRRTGGELAVSHETSASGFFPLDGLPPLCPHRAGICYLELARRHLADPTLATAFD